MAVAEPEPAPEPPAEPQPEPPAEPVAVAEPEPPAEPVAVAEPVVVAVAVAVAGPSGAVEAQPAAAAGPEPESRAAPGPASGDEPSPAAIPQPMRPLAERGVAAGTGTGTMTRRADRRWRRRAGLLGALVAAAAAVGIFAALDTAGHHQAQARPPSGSHHGSAAPSQPAGGSSAAASPSPPPATPAGGSRGTAGGSGGSGGSGGTGVDSSAPIPAGFRRYQDPTGFSIAMPDGWRVSHQGHYVYLTPPSGAEFLLIDQSSHPQPNPLADWRQQEANREGTYPGYHRIRLVAIHYPQAEKAADWEFTYYRQGVLTHVLNRNILTNSTHAYALYWSTPQAEWSQSWHIFQTLARTFQPAS